MKSSCHRRHGPTVVPFASACHIPFLRYTLTEGDFHHLKKARLTHLHLPPAPCDLKILTIMECDSTESSSVNISETAAPKLPLTIYQVSWQQGAIYLTDVTQSGLFSPTCIGFSLQPTERRVPDWKGQSLSGGLPGDPHHSTILDQGHRKKRSQTVSFTVSLFLLKVLKWSLHTTSQ